MIVCPSRRLGRLARQLARGFTFGLVLTSGGLVAGAPLGAQAQVIVSPTEPVDPAQPGDIDRLSDALGLEDLLAVMRDEGISYGATIAADLFEGTPPAAWDAAVRDIYDFDRMNAAIDAAFGDAIKDRDVAAMLAFLSTGTGAQAAALEVSTRAARLDADVELAADEAAALALATNDPRIAMIDRYIAANDLIERNVADAMTSNFAFYQGLRDGGALPAGVTQDDILTDVWGQSAEIRQTLTDWHYSFLFMAFSPLDDAQLEAYIGFSESPAGRDLNTALFAAFDIVYTDISYDLGRAAARFMITQDL